ncbi:hypothetical protein AVEN_147105-1 [Araneus ventricosus]|uniref:Uncharacterized protein n=1 Tax=Araneus ventricosus TaxID=182803 RepID=A0A4Y2J6U8_ARAVE|nr:hypothetical protein AVEN_147105-1 [Araneus ventricosus]
MLFHKDVLLQKEIYIGITKCKLLAIIPHIPTDIDSFVAPSNQFEETILVKLGAHRLKEVLHSLNTNLISMFGRDVPIALSSMLEKGESVTRARSGLYGLTRALQSNGFVLEQ